jgi:uncharacterized membrane protein YeiH
LRGRTGPILGNRDLLLGHVPVALTDPWFLPLVCGAALTGFFFASLVHRGKLVLDILDPIWMALFAVIGAQQTLNADLGALAAILVGCVSAFGGAVLRDLLAGETPQLVLPGPINYLAAILGAVLYVAAVQWLDIDKVVAEWVTIALVFGLRMLALRYGIKAPEPVDVPHHLRRRVLHGRRSLRRRSAGGRAAETHATPGGRGPTSRPGGTPPPGDDG